MKTLKNLPTGPNEKFASGVDSGYASWWIFLVGNERKSASFFK